MMSYDEHCNSGGTVFVKNCDQFETRGVDEVSTRPRLREDARNAPRLIDHAYGVVEWDNWKSVRDLA